MSCKDIEQLTYRRQYILSDGSAYVPPGWIRSKLSPSFTLASHPDLAVSSARTGTVSLTCLGHVLDPRRPGETNVQVLRRLAAETKVYEDLEQQSIPLGGRWLLIAGVGEQVRLYPDAGGTRGAFYAPDANGKGFYVASQPNLLADALGLARDEDVDKRFLAANHGNSWPAARTPFAGVRQLLPNHFLDLRARRGERYWPIADRPRMALEEAVRSIHDLLHGFIRALLARGKVAVPLTAGYDSRTLFAAAGELRPRLRFFSIIDPKTPYADIYVPRRIARAYGTRVDLIRAKPIPPWFWPVHRKNSANMVFEPGDIKLPTFGAEFGDAFVLMGGVAEVGKCFYYSDGVHPRSVTPDSLAGVSGYAGNPVAIAAFEEWLAEASSVQDTELLDLFYWEHRVGNWLSLASTSFDTVCEVIAAFNSREYISTVLSLDVAFRREPFEFLQRICELGAPGITRIPFNASPADILNYLAPFLPWRLRHGIREWRLKRAGLVYGDEH